MEATEIYKFLYDSQWRRNQNTDAKIKKIILLNLEDHLQLCPFTD